MECSPVLSFNLDSVLRHVQQYLAARDWTKAAEKALTLEIMSIMVSPEAPVLLNALRKEKGARKILSLVNPYIPREERDSEWLMLPCAETLDSWRPALAAGKLPAKVKSLPGNPALEFSAMLDSFAKRSPAHSDFVALVKEAMRKEYTFSF